LQHKSRVSKDGYFILKSDLTRSQQLNLADVLEKLRTIIREVERPKTKELSAETVEKLRRRHERANRERLMEKRRQADVKSSRQAPKVEF
jgi:peptidyl-tRNA hydrolase ICT1